MTGVHQHGRLLEHTCVVDSRVVRHDHNGVGLGEHTKEAQEAFERAMQAAPEVVECHNITGPIEYLLRGESADLPSYKQFHTDVLGTSPHVTAITTYVVMGSPKDKRA